MNITLINPSFGSKIVKKEDTTMQYNRVYQPLSLASLASLLREKNYEVKLIDLNAEPGFNKNIEAEIVVITTAAIYNWQCPYLNLNPIKDLIHNIKTKHLLIIGPHGTSNPDYVLRELNNVIIIRGEPEFKTLEVIEALKHKKSLSKITCISFKKEKKNIHNKGIASFDFNKSPIPAYDLLPMHLYCYELMGKNFSIVETSRGCPFNCNFCLKTMYGKKYTTKDTNKIIQELNLLKKKFNIKNILFIDLEFCINKQRIKDLCNRIIKEKLNLNWAIQARVDTLDKELLLLMKKSGCSIIHCGVEFGTKRVLKLSNKKVTFQRIKEMFYIIRKTGIKTLAYFLLGYPDETKQEINKTIKFANELNPDISSFIILVPYPGTQIYEKYKNKLRLFAPTASLILQPKELEKLRKKAIIKFYLRPKYIFTQLLSIRSIKDIKFLYKGFFKLFLPLLSNPY